MFNGWNTRREFLKNLTITGTAVFMGRLTKVNQIYIDPDLCTGCGICEHVCPRTDAPGIFITPADEQREKVIGIV